MIGNLFAIILVTLFCLLFWQQRRQSELAKQMVAHRCKQLEIQVLSVSFKGHRFRHKSGKIGWYTVYQFEFSSLGDDYYIGELTMVGFHASHFDIPPYRM
ncbi:conserved hypothetical protein [Vibrio nigripulchritudo MADA3029]|uniref:DUF3301 domain-containing protein n=1 Tax=Vibrio nigripulchritudo TaxID=28173 RepID=UPI0003B1ACE4|nr:DUF3301 domain-containing protein [Vibrio nigripulchritudo]CCN48426.1 conserved hypothetical protein [Vibrio nigripulchritudo MADA3020]CCN52197.1 conserved hypothetical protein [Vibrio nigripulchritudo MADA3021]CCN58078.1 conserved hypothetical protein [Vibrio nigripulchritudo MADA3029]